MSVLRFSCFLLCFNVATVTFKKLGSSHSHQPSVRLCILRATCAAFDKKSVLFYFVLEQVQGEGKGNNGWRRGRRGRGKKRNRNGGLMDTDSGGIDWDWGVG